MGNNNSAFDPVKIPEPSDTLPLTTDRLGFVDILKDLLAALGRGVLGLVLLAAFFAIGAAGAAAVCQMRQPGTWMDIVIAPLVGCVCLGAGLVLVPMMLWKSAARSREPKY